MQIPILISQPLRFLRNWLRFCLFRWFSLTFCDDYERGRRWKCLKAYNQQKNTFLYLFSLLSILLVLLPFLVVFNEGLTRIIESTWLYRGIQHTIVPYEVKIVASILYLFHIPTIYQADGLTVNGTFLRVTWNCLGWQSMLFFLLSLTVGLQGEYTRTSRIEAVVLGFAGTFLMNVLRIVVIVLLGGYLPYLFAIVFHDYFAAFLTLLWLFFFWWFSYRFILEEQQS